MRIQPDDIAPVVAGIGLTGKYTKAVPLFVFDGRRNGASCHQHGRDWIRACGLFPQKQCRECQERCWQNNAFHEAPPTRCSAWFLGERWNATESPMQTANNPIHSACQAGWGGSGMALGLDALQQSCPPCGIRPDLQRPDSHVLVDVMQHSLAWQSPVSSQPTLQVPEAASQYSPFPQSH